MEEPPKTWIDDESIRPVLVESDTEDDADEPYCKKQQQVSPSPCSSPVLESREKEILGRDIQTSICYRCKSECTQHDVICQVCQAKDTKRKISNGPNKLVNWADKVKQSLAAKPKRHQSLPVLAGFDDTEWAVQSADDAASLAEPIKSPDEFVYNEPKNAAAYQVEPCRTTTEEGCDEAIIRFTPPDLPYLTPTYRTGEPHCPLRMKDSRALPTHEERVNAYTNAYYHCIVAKTDLVPWLKKQYSKGPPDTMFEYIPPPRRFSKGLFSLFKKKKCRENTIGETNQHLKSMISLSCHVSASQSPPPERKLRRPKSMPGPCLQTPAKKPSPPSLAQSMVEEPVSILKKQPSPPPRVDRTYHSDSEQTSLWSPESEDEVDVYSPPYSDILFEDQSQKKKSYRRKTQPFNHLLPPALPRTRRRSSASSIRSISPNYYSPPVPPPAMYPYDQMLPRRLSWAREEWEQTLDDLCVYFRHIDRGILEQYLDAARGDFDAAKQMCIEDIMVS
ncbi:hypothetical protein DFQ28_007437 [Apophysomyces sp. BC1034]|nr:hypothetical protein DFQ30_009746 [Apophysomyces sp. BC1015]KAG0182370.1 hypothetical protein DFQ29_004423 [Apophysomyces sp. BC1021]KAG0192827.1 hypothetical protein DFQ28_007437 [Apophysomyces sp. BC1034]